MSRVLKRLSFLNIVIFSFVLLLFLNSCSQVTPELTNANYSVIFEYPDEESNPYSRLCIFMESNTNINRYERIEIESLSTGYVWNIDEIAKVIVDDRKWAGNTNLVVPEDEYLPTGKYKITYFNADEKETTVYVDINYDKAFYETTVEDAPELIKKEYGGCNIIISDKDRNIIYYGEKISNFYTPRGIWNTFRNAAFSQDVYYSSGNFIICIMPEKKVALEDNKD